MIFKDFFQRWSKQRERSKLSKSIRTISNKHTLAENRLAAMDRLKSIGSEEALCGLLARYNFIITDKSIQDLEEKERVESILIEFGERAVPALKRFIESSTSIAWPVRILKKLISEDSLIHFLLGRVSTEEIVFNERLLDKNVELLNHLAEYNHIAIVKKATELLTPDNDDRIRFQAIAIIEKAGDENARNSLLKLATDPSETARIKNRIFEAFAHQRWSVHGYRGKIEELLPSEYSITREGMIKSKNDYGPKES